jgi:glutathionylspermidine synthase
MTMQRIPAQPRDNWQQKVEEKGFVFHTVDEAPYWNETAFYQFTSTEIDAIEKATYALNEMALAAVDHVIQNNLWDRFSIPATYQAWIRKSWDRDEQTIVGRFDLALTADNQIKLLEYNADTPTALLEAAVIQWFWLKDVHPDKDQFNSIHERLIEAWTAVKPHVGSRMFFASIADHAEDFMTVSYLRDTAMQAGLETDYIPIEQIGWNRIRRAFVDLQERPIQNCFKLYPWEWLLHEQFAPNLLLDTTAWLEAPWKILLSNKAILVVLAETHPDSPYLLPASFEPLPGDYVRKPTQAREGSNIQIVQGGRTTLETPGDYTAPYVYQQLAPLQCFDGNYPVVGSWIVNGYACGMGIREDSTLVTGNLSRFIPHLFS